MSQSIYDKVIQALEEAENHNSHVMIKPEVILWPDPDELWIDVIGVLQQHIPQLLIYGNYAPEKNQGPAIWIKCMVARVLDEANWHKDVIPIFLMILEVSFNLL